MAEPVKLPRWCPLCITNGYHKPENCPSASASPNKHARTEDE